MIFHRWTGGAVLLLSSIVLCGCNTGAPEMDFTRMKPRNSDLVGTYVLTDETILHGRAVINGDPYRPGTVYVAQNGTRASVHKLILHSDGTFAAQSIPLWNGEQIKSFQSGGGNWKVYGSAGARWSVSFSSPRLKLIPNDGNSAIELLGQASPYRIRFDYGYEPDDDTAMLFERVD